MDDAILMLHTQKIRETGPFLERAPTYFAHHSSE